MYIVKVNSCPECGATKLHHPLKDVRYVAGGGSIGTSIKDVKQCKSCGLKTPVRQLNYIDLVVDDDERLCPDCYSPRIRKTNTITEDGIPFYACEGCSHLRRLHEFKKAKDMEDGKNVIKTKDIEKDRAKPFDCFISHASEDKDAIARPLYVALTKKGLSVWFDEAELKLGDSLRKKIDEGLASCSYGIVILSHSFFNKNWPQSELDGLVAREMIGGDKVILPVWHNITERDVIRYSPTLAGKLAANSGAGISNVAKQILDVCR